MGSIFDVLQAGAFGSIDTVFHIGASAVRGMLDAVTGVLDAGGSGGSTGPIGSVYGSLQTIYGGSHGDVVGSLAPGFHG